MKSLRTTRCGWRLLIATASTIPGILYSQAGSTAGVRLENSGPANAQPAFLQGLTALHNFQYQEAAEAFQEAQRIDPGFVLAYWGEAMTHHRALWGHHDVAAARAVLTRLRPTPEQRLQLARTPVERGLLSAAEALFAVEEIRAAARIHAEALEALHRRFPDDIEIGARFGLSLLATAPPGPRGLATRMRAADLLERLFAEHPRHPGVAHYLIHTYDDVDHAPLGLRAAERYATLAPQSAHAQHMPSHIFLQLGRWDAAARVNQVAYDASVAAQTSRGWPLAQRDWHSLLWLGYAVAQQGRYARAREIVEHFGAMARQTGEGSAVNNHRGVQAIVTFESGDWSRAPTFDEARVGHPVNQANAFLATAMRALHEKDSTTLQRIRSAMAEFRAAPQPHPVLEIIELTIQAFDGALRNGPEGAIPFLNRAATLEAALPVVPGISLPIKPARELYGEVLLAAGRPSEAQAQFRSVLERIPQRPLSLWGLARAQLSHGDTATASATLLELERVWSQADAGSLRMERLRELRRSIGPSDPAADSVLMEDRAVSGPVHRLAAHGPAGHGEMVFSRGPEGLLWVDTGPDDLTPRFREALSAAAPEGPRWLVTTHYHSDHVAGNRVLEPATARIAHAETRRSLDAGERPRPALPLGGDQLPFLLVLDSATVHANGEAVVLLHLPDAHTRGDLAVLFPRSKVAYLGDVVLAGGALPYARDVDALIQALAQLEARLDDDWIIIPGHGEPITRAKLRELRTTVAALHGMATMARTEGWADQRLAAEAAGKYGHWSSRFADVGEWTVRLRHALDRQAQGPRLLVVNRSSHEVVTVDPAHYQVLARIAVKEGPHEAAVSGHTMFVPAFGVYPRVTEPGRRAGAPSWIEGRGSTLSIASLDGSRPARHIDLGECTRPHGVASNDRKVWITCEEIGQVWELDAGTGNVIRRFSTGQRGSHTLVHHPVDRALWVANVRSGSITRIDLASGDTTTLTTGAGAEGLALSPDGRELWVGNTRAGTISIVDTERRTVTATIPAGGRFPVRLGFVPGRQEVWVVLNQSNQLAIIDPRSRTQVGAIPTGSTPLGLTIEPDGARVFVTLPREDSVLAIDTRSRQVIRRLTVGFEPDGLTWVP